MKKILLLLTIISFFSTFNACVKAEDSENLFETQVNDISVLKTEETKIETESINEYPFGNMQKNAPPGNFMDYGDAVLFTYISNGHSLLYMFDKEMKEVSYFCKDATCKHDSMKCVSAGVSSNLEQYKGRIYALNSYNQIVELKDDHFEKIVGGDVYNFWHANDKLYAVTRDSSLVTLGNDGEKVQILVDEYSDYWNVVFDDYLYGCSSKGITRIDLSNNDLKEETIIKSGYSLIDGENIYFFDDKTLNLFRCNLDGSDVMQLTEQPVLPASINFDDNYLFYRLFTNQEIDGPDSHDLYRQQKDDVTKIEKVGEFPNYIGTIYTVPGYNEIIVGTFNDNGESIVEEFFVVKKDGTDATLLQIPKY